MAMDVGGSKGGPKSDINVTPLVDVMLVLLIIFMVTAPMMQQGLQVNLPQARRSDPVTSQPVYVTVPADSLQVPCEAVAESKVTPLGSVSVSVTPVAPEGRCTP